MKESSFVREVENRLDVLFGIGLDSVERGRNAGPDPVDPRAMLDGISADAPLGAGGDGDAAAVPDMMDNRLSGDAESPESDRDRRYHILLEEETPDPVTESGAAHPCLEEIEPVPGSADSGAAEDGDRRFEQIFGDIESVTPALFSPVRTLKSIILSLEWEISDAILGRLDRELNGLQELYRHERTVLGFLRILRFLERYIQVKQGDSHTESVKLLFSVYDDLERVVLSKAMAEEAKRAVLVADIGKYRNWVEKIDLSSCAEAAAGEDRVPAAGDNMASEPEAVSMPDEKDVEPAAAVLPVSVAATLKAEEGEAERHREREEEAGPDFPEAVKAMEPHDAFAFALEEIRREVRKMIRSEFEALRAELGLGGTGASHPESGTVL